MGKKGRATATFDVVTDVNEGDLTIVITVPAMVDDWNGVRAAQVNGSVALGKFVAKQAVAYASVPTKARGEQEAKHAQLVAAGKTDDEADTIMVMFYPEWVR